MPTTSAGLSDCDLPAKLHQLAANYGRRSLDILTTRKEQPLLDYHVQGVARIDYAGGSSTLVVSASQAPHGVLWFARFQRELVGAPGKPRERLSTNGATVATVVTPTLHPGGMQAVGTWLAVANEAGQGPSIDIYDVRVQDNPLRYARLNLQDKPGAGWVAMAERAPDDLLLFVGGAKFATQESWVYSFRPSSKTFHMEGTFAGTPDKGEWGPQDGGSLFARPGGQILLVTQGTKGPDGRDAYRERIRCYDVALNGGKVTLVQLPGAKPETYVIDAEQHAALLGPMFFPSPGLRWGSNVFEDERGALSLYVTARNPVYRDEDKRFHLQLIELQHALR